MIPRTTLAPGLEVPRLVTGLWQVADQERGGRALDADAGAAALAAYAADGFDAFDMADHYGSAEIIAGRLLQRPEGAHATVLTKWVPEPGPMNRELVREAVDRARERLGVARIPLLQFHWWRYEDPRYLDALAALAALAGEGAVGHLGLTNVDAAHLHLVRAHGLPVVTNQVCGSLLDRRFTGRMSEVCARHGVKLLAYGTLAGGFLSERWLGAPAPPAVGDWSKLKYRRFVDAAGGWDALQALLRAADRIARKHRVSIANVAVRWVLEQPAVGAVIVGARLGEAEHRADNARVFSFALDDEDRGGLDEAFAATKPIPGDCGDEYRRPPFLTASGDLSHHLGALPPVFAKEPVPGHPDRWRVGSGSVWEPIAGYARAVRAGERIEVAGTTATHGHGTVVAPGDAGAQTTYVLDKIAAAIGSLGGRIEDVVRTRVYLARAEDWEAVAREHGRVFGAVRPANTMLEVSRLLGDGYLVEIEAEAIAG